MDKQKFYAEIEIAADFFEKTKDFDWAGRRRVIQFLESAWSDEEIAKEMAAKEAFMKQQATLAHGIEGPAPDKFVGF